MAAIRVSPNAETSRIGGIFENAENKEVSELIRLVGHYSTHSTPFPDFFAEYIARSAKLISDSMFLS